MAISTQRKGGHDMAAVQNERSLNSQNEDVRDMIELLKQLTSDEKNIVKGIMIGFQAKNEMQAKTA